MEKFYPTNHFMATDNVPLDSYFEQFSKLLPKMENQPDGDLAGIQKLMGPKYGSEIVKQLATTCDITHLKCEQENSDDFPVENVEEFDAKINETEYIPTSAGNNLNVAECKRQFQEQIISSELAMKYFIKFKPEENGPTDLIPGENFLVTIHVYRPFDFKYFMDQCNSSYKLRLLQEIIALGSNTLAEIRDKIECISDGPICCEVENTTVKVDDLPKAKDKYPSGFIFIDNKFYNDFRANNSIDYSTPIINWAHDKEIVLEKDDICTAVSKLSPKFGYPYVYVHQANCEHIFTFVDAKLLQSNDVMQLNNYPYVSKVKQKIHLTCHICANKPAKWMVTECERFPTRKTFLCTDCCKSYNYIDGEKIGQFKLYPFFGVH